jgi:hypothetical protein
LDEVFHAFEQWGDGQYPMIKIPRDSAVVNVDSTSLHKPRDFNLIVVNEYDFEEKPDSYIPWHDDNMKQSCRNDLDDILTPVISLSLGDSAVFAVMPNKDHSPQLWSEMCNGYTKKYTTAKMYMRGRFAFLLHHGDILLMTGNFQKSFMHKTWARGAPNQNQNVDDIVKNAGERNYVFLRFPDDQSRLKKSNQKRWSITGRHIHYHDMAEKECPPKKLPREQHYTPAPPPRPPPINFPFPFGITLTFKAPPPKAPPETYKRKLEIAKVEYIAAPPTTAQASDSDNDEVASPDVLYPDTPSTSDEDVRVMVEIPLARHTELKYCRRVRQHQPSIRATEQNNEHH